MFNFFKKLFNPEEQIQAEEWASLKGYEGQYFVSNSGKVKSVKKMRDGRIRETILNASDAGNRMLVRISFKGKPKTLKLHRLVAHAFVDNPEGHDEVSFKDNNYKNCKSSNLMWRPRFDKKNNAKSYSKAQRGQKNSQHKISNFEAQKVYNEAVNGFKTQKEIGAEFGIDQSSVSQIKTGARRSSHINGIN